MQSFIPTNKFLLIILFLNLILNSIANGINDNNNNIIVNLTPFKNNCIGVPFGIGYSFAIGKCLNNIGSFLNLGSDGSPVYDYQSWLFNLTQITNTTEYYVTAFQYEQQNCSGYESQASELFIQTESCEGQIEIAQFNGTIKGTTNDEVFFGVSLSKLNPVYPDNSQIYAVFESQDSSSSDSNEPTNQPSQSCSNNNFLYAVTLSNALEIDYIVPSNFTKQFTCQNGNPYTYDCTMGANCNSTPVNISCSQLPNSDNFYVYRCSH